MRGILRVESVSGHFGELEELVFIQHFSYIIFLMVWSIFSGKIKFMEFCVECISCKHVVFEIIESLVELGVTFYDYLHFMEKIVKKLQKLPIELVSWLLYKHFIYLVPESVKWVSINFNI